MSARAADGHGEPVLEIDGLRKSYGGVEVLRGVSLRVERSEVYGFLGPNGAGKTTTLEIVEGLRDQDAGTVRVFGLERDRHLRAIRTRLGVSLQKNRYWGLLTVEETLRLFRGFYPRGLEIDELVRLFDLEEKRDSRMRGLSGGQAQRVALALAMVNDPDLVLLDEPTIGLDPQARRRLWDQILRLKEQRKTVVLTTHYMDEAEMLCDRIGIIHRGKIIAEGTPAELVGRLEAGQALRFKVVGAGSAAEDAADDGSGDGMVAAIQAEPWCRSARRLDETQILAYCSELGDGIRGLLAWAEARDVTIVDLETRRPSLDDVFLHYADLEGDAVSARDTARLAAGGAA